MKDIDIVTKTKSLPDITIKEALKKIDEAGNRILFICDKNDRLIGSLSDGDIRRKILKTGDLYGNITSCYNRNPIFVIKSNHSLETAKKLMLEKTVDVIPVVNNNRKIVNLIFWKDIFKEESISNKKLYVPVVIMAGGKGKRLDPFTKILPKPLIPVGEKPIIEIIMDKFRQQGIRNYYVILNYKGEMVKNYFESTKKDYKIHYVWEKEFLGTVGGLKLLPSDLGDTFIVSNCDIIVEADYADILWFHQKNKNILTVVGSIQHYKIPYGIVHFEKDGRIKEIREKPEFDFTVNTGVYMLSQKALPYISNNKHLDMTDFIQHLLNEGENVGVYPVSQKSYLDVGQWEEYKKYTEKLI